MQLRSTQRLPKQFGSPTASGGLSRLAADRARRAGLQLEALLLRAGLSVDQIDDPEQRIDARSQVAFLEIVAQALGDEFLGFSLAEEFDCRDLGLLYYVMSSSDTLRKRWSVLPVTVGSPMKPSCFSIGRAPTHCG